MLDKQTLQAIRYESESYIEKKELLFNRNLPLLDMELLVRNLDAVVDRILILYGLASTAFGFDNGKVMQWFEQEKLMHALENDEKSYLLKLENSQISKEGLISLVESLWVLAWAVKKTEVIDSLTACSQEFVMSFPDIRKAESTEKYRKNCCLRESLEIIKMLDVGYCLHWSFVQNPKQKEFKHLKSYVIPSRRLALEWLCSNEDWSNIILDT